MEMNQLAQGRVWEPGVEAAGMAVAAAPADSFPTTSFAAC